MSDSEEPGEMTEIAPETPRLALQVTLTRRAALACLRAHRLARSADSVTPSERPAYHEALDEATMALARLRAMGA